MLIKFSQQQNTYTGEYDEGHEYDRSSDDKFMKYMLSNILIIMVTP